MSGLRAISTTTSLPSLRRATSSVWRPIGRAFGARSNAARYSAWRDRTASGTERIDLQADQLVDAVAEQRRRRRVREDDPSLSVDDDERVWISEEERAVDVFEVDFRCRRGRRHHVSPLQGEVTGATRM